MTEAENIGVTEEIATPEAEDMGVAHVEAEQTEEISPPQETDQEMNFRKLREINEQLQRERDQERERNQKDREMFEALMKRSISAESTPEPEVDAYAGLAGDDWVTVEQQKKLDALRDEKNAAKTAEAIKKALEEDRAKRYKEEAPQRLKNRFGDFDAVVTEENVKQLQAQEPDVAQALSLIGDEEARAVAAYKYIKVFIPKAAETTASKQRIQQNANQPKSLSSAGGNSPLAQAGSFEQGLTPALKKQLFAEMQSAARQG